MNTQSTLFPAGEDLPLFTGQPVNVQPATFTPKVHVRQLDIFKEQETMTTKQDYLARVHTQTAAIAKHLTVNQTYTIQNGMGGTFEAKYQGSTTKGDITWHQFKVTTKGWTQMDPYQIAESSPDFTWIVARHLIDTTPEGGDTRLEMATIYHNNNGTYTVVDRRGSAIALTKHQATNEVADILAQP